MKWLFWLGPSNERLDLLLKERLAEEGIELTRSEISKAFQEGRVRQEGESKPPKSGLKLSRECQLEVDLPEKEELQLEPEDIPLDVVYEDEHLLVINKPRGMVVHPAVGHKSGTLVNALLHHCAHSLSDVNEAFRPGIVHRIDKDTSGLLVVAKTNACHRALAEMLRRHEIQRVYLAVVYGNFAEASGRVEAPIGRDPNNRQKMAVREGGKPAFTNFEVLRSLGKYSLLRLVLETGRTHQIRVHMKFIGHPVVGDPLYASGRKDLNLDGQLLHAAELHFIHPMTGEPVDCYAPLPAVFEAFLEEVGG